MQTAGRILALGGFSGVMASIALGHYNLGVLAFIGMVAGVLIGLSPLGISKPCSACGTALRCVPGDGPVRYELTFVVRRTDKPEAKLRVEIPEFGEEVVRAENPALNALLTSYEDIYGPKPIATPAGEAEDGGATAPQTASPPEAEKD